MKLNIPGNEVTEMYIFHLGWKGVFSAEKCVLYDGDGNSYLADSISSNEGVTSIYFYIFWGSYGSLSRLFLQR